MILGGKQMNTLDMVSKEERVALFYETLQLVKDDEDIQALFYETLQLVKDDEDTQASISQDTIKNLLEGLENKKLVPADMGGCWRLISKACKKLAVFYS